MNGGEGGIRTLDRGLAYTPLAGARLQPLGHLSQNGRHNTTPGEKWQSGNPLFSGISVIVALISFAALFLNTLIDLFTVNRYFLGSVDADTNLVTLYPQYGDGYFITYHQGFTNSAS